MPQYVKKIRTSSGDLKIDYEALANLPKLGALAPKNKVGKYDLANDALDGYATTDYVDNAIKNIDVDLTDYATKDYVDSAVDSCKQYSQGLEYTLYSNGEYEVTGIGSCTDTDIIIPAIYNGKRVTSIGYQAFYYRTSLTSITIPDSVTTIGERAFYNCTSLTSIAIPDSVTSIGDLAFLSCNNIATATMPTIAISAIPQTNLTTVVLTSGESIGDYAFLNYASLTSVTIGNSVTSIGFCAFRSCSSLKNVTIGDSVTRIGEYAFQYCPSLTNVTIPDNVKSIGQYAFSDCTSLTSITIPDGVTTISNYAFQGCTSLTNITIPDSVTNIRNGAFQGCASLTIYGEAASKPAGWSTDWNPDNRPVVWSAALDFASVNDKLANISIEVDSTLTQSGKAADAKAVGDAFTNFEFITLEDIDEICGTTYEVATANEVTF